MRTFSLSHEDIILHCTLWEPEGRPKGIVQIVHGVAEYVARYDSLAQFLTKEGYLVVGEDHAGHGYTASEEQRGYLTGGWMGVVRGIHRLYETVRQQHPHVPYFILGHSMGSFLLRTYLFTYHTPLTGAMISGTGQIAAPVIPAAWLACQEEGLRLGDSSLSPLLEKMMFGGYNAKFKPARTPYDWVNSDPAAVDAYAADPLCGFPVTVQLCKEMLKGIRMIQSKTNLSRMQKDLPVFFFAGDQDPVGDMGKGVWKTVKDFQSAGMKNVSCKLYEGMRHEVLNEPNRQLIFEDILNWMENC